MAGPFRVLARQVWIKADGREPPVTGGEIRPRAVQASSSDEGTEASNLINHSGLRNRDADNLEEHSVDAAHMWRTARGDAQGWIEFDLGEVQSLDTICLWNFNDAWYTDRGVRKADISVWTQDAGWQKIRDDLLIERAQGSEDYDDPMYVKLDGVKAQKVRFDDLASFGDPDSIGLSEVQFFETPGPKAIRPQPYDGSTDVDIDAALEWRPGLEAAGHRVYLGVTPTDLKFLGMAETSSVRLSTLSRDTTYYWRVDEVRADETVTPGSVWSFTTGRDITGPKDVVVGVPDEGVTSDYSTVGWPSNESPHYVVDNKASTKYLHLAGEVRATGFRTTPEAGAAVVTGLTFTTANDAEERDPVAWELSGSNESIEGPYTVIARGPIVDFNQPTAWPRGVKNATPVAFENNTAYKHYQVLFPAVRAPDRANSMQIAEVELLAVRSQGGQPTLGDVELVQVPARGVPTLVGWWKLDESTGQDVVDSSAWGNWGTIVGNAKWQPAGGQIGGALEFDGSTYVRIDNETAFDITGEITVAAWVKVRTFDKKWQTIIAKGDNTWRLAREGNRNSVQFTAGRVDDDRIVLGNVDINDGQWHHIVGVGDANAVSLYVDGVLDDIKRAPGGMTPDDEPVYIGENSVQPARGRFWNGWIDDVCVFNYALDANDVKALYAGHEPTTLRLASSKPRPLRTSLIAAAEPAEPVAQVQSDAAVAQNPPAEKAPAQATDASEPPARKSKSFVSIVLILVVVGAIAGVTALGKQKAP